MRKAAIGIFSVVVIFTVGNLYACPMHDHAKSEDNAAKASMNSHDGSCAMSGAKTQATVAKSTDKVPAVQAIDKKSPSSSKAIEKPATYKAAPDNTVKVKKDAVVSTTVPNVIDMSEVNKNN